MGSQIMTNGCDILIGGGGLVGLALGTALARGGLNTVLCDPLPVDTTLDARFDGRVSALNRPAMRFFSALGVWQGLAPQVQPIEQILVTDGKPGCRPSPLSLHLDGAEGDGEPLGYIAENRHIRAALLEAAARAGVAVRTAAVTGLEVGPRAVRLSLSDGGEISARLAVAADGRASPLRELAGIKLVGRDYGQGGLVATVAHEKPHHGVAYEHFLPAGPFAILPMKGNFSSLVWTEKTRDAAAMMQLARPEFEAEIVRRFGDHLGRVEAQEGRWCYPLRVSLARAFASARFALCGDAAHGIHPLAGQGLNLGLKDAAVLAEVVFEAAQIGLDIGGRDVLKRYQTRRRFECVATAAAMDGFNRLFSNDIAPLRLARDLSIGIADAVPALRKLIMRLGFGEAGDTPKSMRAV
jgi:2-octaprenyl-6-methoxyphenol hydroxylase